MQEQACQRLVSGAIGPLTRSVAELVPISPRVLWGNVASAAKGAARQLANSRPDLACSGWSVAQMLVRQPELGHEHGQRSPAAPARC